MGKLSRRDAGDRRLLIHGQSGPIHLSFLRIRPFSVPLVTVPSLLDSTIVFATTSHTPQKHSLHTYYWKTTSTFFTYSLFYWTFFIKHPPHSFLKTSQAIQKLRSLTRTLYFISTEEHCDFVRGIRACQTPSIVGHRSSKAKISLRKGREGKKKAMRKVIENEKNGSLSYKLFHHFRDFKEK